MICCFLYNNYFTFLHLQYQKELTPLIIGTVEFIVNTLPKIQYYISFGFALIGLFLLIIGFKKVCNTKQTKVNKKVVNGK